ncbi:hypothetical protein Trihar35433_4003 [Trichoderma harzianum]|nr:hypothetical protein Trihar35433_4003 [Trichoderma harzianum]
MDHQRQEPSPGKATPLLFIPRQKVLAKWYNDIDLIWKFQENTVLLFLVFLKLHVGLTAVADTLGREWKNELAKGIAVDEAGNISLLDLYRVWDDTLLPCLLGGDDMQLPPTVMTKEDRDSDGHHRNRQAQDGTMSVLEFFRASGWPIYRLQTQLRMAKGLFDTCHCEVYSDVPFNYGTGSDLGNHATGVVIHCDGTKCPVDGVAHPKRNPDQVLNALDFLADMVKTARISAADIAIITPYAANVELVNRRRMRPEYEAFSAMPTAATVDSFQGREANIIVFVIMGTTEEVSPKFTTDQNRLFDLI